MVYVRGERVAQRNLWDAALPMPSGGARTGCETALPNLDPKPETSKRKGAGASLHSSSWEFRCLFEDERNS